MLNKVKINYIYNVAYQILLIIVPFITAPYISRVLGAEKIGEYSYANSIVYYFILFAALGTATFGRREISYFQDNISERSKKFWQTEIISCCSVLIFTVIYFIFIRYNRLPILYYIFSIDIISVAFDISWLFQGLEEFKKIVFRNFIFKILNIVYIFTFVKDSSDLNIYVFGLSILTFCSNISLWVCTKKIIEKPNFKELELLKAVKPIVHLFIPTIAVFISSSIDKTMIGIFCENPLQNGYYEQSMKTIRIILTLITAMSTVLSPRIGFLFQKNDTNKIKKIIKQSYEFIFFLGFPICFGLISLADIFIPWFYGYEFIEAVPIVMILSFLTIFISFNNVTGTQYLIPLKKQKQYTFTVTFGSLINILLNLLLIPKFYAVGAAIASVISEFSITIMQIIVCRKEIVFKQIFIKNIPYIISSFIMLIILYCLHFIFPVSTLSLIILVLLGIFIYIVSLMIIKNNIVYEYIIKIMNSKFRKNKV